MTRCLVPFAHAGPADFCKRRATSYGAAIGQKQTLMEDHFRPKADITSTATGMDEPGYESKGYVFQFTTCNRFCPT